jgi:hypothetical protein
MSVAPIVQLGACPVPLRTFTSTAEYPFVTFFTDLAILLIVAACVDAQVLRCRRMVGAARVETEEEWVTTTGASLCRAIHYPPNRL